VAMLAAWLAVATVACSGDDGPTACATPTPGTEFQMLDFEFAPLCLEVAGDSISIANLGEAPHTFTIPETDIDVRLDPGASDDIAIGDLTPGLYEVRCTLHPQMLGALRIS